MKTATEKRLPEVGEFVPGYGTFVSIEEVIPPPPPVPDKDYIFEEISAHFEVRLGDELLKSSSSYGDWRERGSSIDTALAVAKRYAAKRRLTPDSEIEVVVVKEVVRGRYRPRQDGIENLYCKSVQSFERRGGRDYFSPPTEEIVWSSKQKQVAEGK